MEEANKQAVRAILQPQNSEGTGVLDLHGLYVKEAEEATKAFLLEQQRAKRFGAVEVITGAGHHSDGQEAKIRVRWVRAPCTVKVVLSVYCSTVCCSTAVLRFRF